MECLESNKTAELFASKYRNLCSTVAYSTSDKDRIKHCRLSVHVLLTYPLVKIMLAYLLKKLACWYAEITQK